MYEELKKNLLTLYKSFNSCTECSLKICDGEKCAILQAIDVLDRQESELHLCKNELCLQCGDYKRAHLGACDDCRWRNV